MNLLHVLPSINPKLGGVSEAIRNFEIGFKTIQNQSLGKRYVLCLDDHKEVILWNNHGLIVHALGKVSNPWQYHKGLLEWLELNYSKFNVIIVHGIWLYHSYAVYKFLGILKKRELTTPQFFIMPHGMLDPWFQKDKTRKIKALRNAIYWKFIERNVVNNADGLLFTCEQEKVLARMPFSHYKPKNEFVIGLGIKLPPSFKKEMENAFLSEYPHLQDKSYFLFLSRIDYKKGIDLLIEAYASILYNYPEKVNEIPILVIAGPGFDSTYGKSILEKVSAYKNLLDKIVFTGMITGDIKWGALYGCDAFILPSHQENFGIAVVEALACAKPVLISNQVNIWKEIELGGGGIIDSDTIEGTQKMLTAFLNKTEIEKKLMGENARNVFENHFNIIKTVEKLIEAIN